MFHILDRYLLIRFIINLFFALLTWIVIFLVVDIIENISKFIDYGATITEFMLYYIYYFPYIISLTLPIAVLLSALFALSSFAQNNEIVAQLSSGISLYRVLAPLIVLSMFISIGAGFFNETIVPESNQRRYDIYRYDIKNNPRNRGKNRNNIYVQDNENRKIIIKFFNAAKNEAREVSIQTFDGPVLVERIDAMTMKWDSSNVWKLKDGTVRRFQNFNEKLTTFEDTVFTTTRITPENLTEIQTEPEEMGFSDLNRFIAELRAIGANPRKWLVERHLKIAMPFTNIIIILLGAPLASRKRRGGAGLNFGISLLISFAYFIIIRVGQVLGHQGNLEPFIAAWLGNFIFLALGLYALFTVQK